MIRRGCTKVWVYIEIFLLCLLKYFKIKCIRNGSVSSYPVIGVKMGQARLFQSIFILLYNNEFNFLLKCNLFNLKTVRFYIDR